MNEAPKQPLSIEQAGNYLKEKNKTAAADIKKEAKDNPISYAIPEDRAKYLIYGISLLEDVSESAKNTWAAITGKSSGLYSTKEVCSILRKLLVLRINGYSREAIAHHLKSDIVTLGKCEELAIRVVRDAIETKRNTTIPLIGHG
jgi:hypothetical protein